MSGPVIRRDTEVVRRWADTIMRQLGSPAGVALHVTASDASGESGQPWAGTAGSAFTSTLRLSDDGEEGRSGDLSESGNLHGDGGEGRDGEGRDGGRGESGSQGQSGSSDGGESWGAGEGRGEDAGAGDDISVRLDWSDGSAIIVLLTADLDQAQAVVQLADQLQESVLESTGGAPAPACPVAGHGHPAIAQIIDATPCWTCPKGGPAHPILPDPDPSSAPDAHFNSGSDH